MSITAAEAQEFFRSASEALVSVMNEPGADPLVTRAAKDGWEILARNFLGQAVSTDSERFAQVRRFIQAMENIIALAQRPRPSDGIRRLQAVIDAAGKRLVSPARS